MRISQQGCILQSGDVRGYSKDAELLLGGIFAIHMDVEYPEVKYQDLPETIRCRRFHIRYYRFHLAMIFAIKEINKSPHILPNVSIGFIIYDSCYNEVRSLLGLMWLLSGRQETVPNYNCYKQAMPEAIAGDTPSKSSMPIARILGLYRYPQVRHWKTSTLLSDKTQFPSFLRTISNGNFEVTALARLVAYFNWTWVGVIISDNDLGREGSQLFIKEIEKYGGCVAFLEILPVHNSQEEVFRILEVVNKSTATAIVVYTTMENLIPLMEEASSRNLTDKIWLGSARWSIESDFPRKDILKTFNGSLGVAHRRGQIPGLKEFLQSIHPSTSPEDVFIKMFWETAFGCKWLDDKTRGNASKNGIPLCTGDERVDSIDNSVYDVYNFRYTYKVSNAVYALAHALNDMYLCVPGQGPFKNGSCANIHNYQPWQLLHYVKKVHFKNTAGEEIFFDENGDVPLSVDILNWQLYPNGSSRYVQVGTYDSRSPKGKDLIVDEGRIQWNGRHSQAPASVCSARCPTGHRAATRKGHPICCFDCIPCSEGEILSPTEINQCIKCPDDQWPNSIRDQCIAKVIEYLSYEEFLGGCLAAISILFSILTACIFGLFLKNCNTPIVKANNRELSYLLLVSLMLCFLCSLLFIGHPLKITCMLRQVIFGIIFSICLSSILAKTITVVMAFSATKPNSKVRMLVEFKLPVYIVLACSLVQVVLCISWIADSSPFPEFNMAAEIGKIVLECNEGSTIFFSCVLGYMGFLACVSLLVAFLARNLPDSFNEAKFITFSMLVFASVWVTFIPAYLSTRGKYMVAVEVFAILSSSSGLLICIFFPKCYIILLKPEMNTRKYITGKNKKTLK
ncbi:extracellular calcium-sensing receptor-like [Rhinatrema bivittatum]|uniref:extracellular calcium-sensing receptor-like n=1 Tax=Rhinatrema bivittatum TaxID=194408 RepID=UPI00112A2358|nr:extracellular calcium-sensing receptor-like [Rhinatrema bivittatum]